MPDISSPPHPRASGMAARLLLRLIGLYRRTFSPLFPAVFGPACGCRFSPTCSHYAAGAVETHGAVRGSWLTLRRLVKCTPLHRGGFDPVPPSPRLRWTGPSSNDSTRPIRPSCARVASTPLASGL